MAVPGLGVYERARLAIGRDAVLGDLLARLARVHGDRGLVEQAGDGLHLTYAAAADRVARMAAGIDGQIGAGDRVVVNVANGYDLFLLCLAASRAGGVAEPVNAQMTSREVDHVVEDAGAVLVGVLAMCRMLLEAGAEDRGRRSVRLGAAGADAVPDDLVKRFKRRGATVTLPLLHTSVGEAAFVDGYGMVELAGGVAVKLS